MIVDAVLIQRQYHLPLAQTAVPRFKTSSHSPFEDLCHRVYILVRYQKHEWANAVLLTY